MNEEHTIRDLLPGYALGILEPAEAEAVRSHLEACPACREELASFQEVTDRLSAAIPGAEPPFGLEERILRGIEPSRNHAPSPFAGQPVRPPRRGTARPALAAVAGLLILFLSAGNVLMWTGIVRRPDRGQGPRLTTAILAGTGDLPGAYGTIVLDPKDNEGVLAVTGLRALDGAHQYQLWLIRDGQRRSGGVFSANADGYASLLLEVPADFRSFRAFGVTIEPKGGSPAPTGPRVMSGRL